MSQYHIIHRFPRTHGFYRYSHDVELAESVRDIVEASVRTLQDRIETGEIIYGTSPILDEKVGSDINTHSS